MNDTQLANRAIEILSNYVLCPPCLGRLFSSYLRGFTNKERGIAILTVIMLELYRRSLNGDEQAIAIIKKIAPSLPSVFKSTLESLGIEPVNSHSCYICGGLMDNLDSLAILGAKLLMDLKAESFVLGISNDEELLNKEDTIWRKFSIVGAESIRNEIKREIGKKIQQLTGIHVDFSNPGALLIYDFSRRDFTIISNPILFKGIYLKTGRNVSQVTWIDANNKKIYPFSVEEAANLASDYLMGNRVVVHAAGREDVDVRMLGTGRPLVLEIKEPQRRNINIHALQDFLNSRSRWVKFRLMAKVPRKDVRTIKLFDKLHKKLYRALIYVERGISSEDIEKLEKEFLERDIMQRTPKRVLRRRPDILRTKKVYWIKGRRLTERLAEFFIVTEGGLYIKELISGDENRTNPSFTSVLDKQAICVELDVLQILGYEEKVELHKL